MRCTDYVAGKPITGAIMKMIIFLLDVMVRVLDIMSSLDLIDRFIG